QEDSGKVDAGYSDEPPTPPDDPSAPSNNPN
ncbi:unnamed protein product, partial [Allacma fusca]